MRRVMHRIILQALVVVCSFLRRDSAMDSTAKANDLAIDPKVLENLEIANQNTGMLNEGTQLKKPKLSLTLKKKYVTAIEEHCQ